MPKLLISTFRTLLGVTLTDDGDVISIGRVSEGHGVYFGLAQRGPFVFAVERNSDINEAPMTPGDPVDTIRIYLKVPGGHLVRTQKHYHHPQFYDLHEIDYDSGGLFVTSSKYPFLIRKNLTGSHRPIDITEVVPDHLKRNDDHTFDAYHINCVKAHGKDLFVLAHNWDDPSFAMRLSLREGLRGRAVCKQVYENLGSCCHDILPAGDYFWTLDSRSAALVRVHVKTGAKKLFQLESPESGKDGQSLGIPFPRGLCSFGNKLAVCYGFNEDRADRMDSEAMLAVFDLKDEGFVNHIHLGTHGNTCAALSI